MRRAALLAALALLGACSLNSRLEPDRSAPPRTWAGPLEVAQSCTVVLEPGHVMLFWVDRDGFPHAGTANLWSSALAPVRS